MSFERFHTDAQRVSRHVASLRLAQGKISISDAALRLIGSPVRISLWFDRDTRRLGIAPADASDPYTYASGIRASKGTAAVSAATFFDYYGITLPKPVLVPVEVGQITGDVTGLIAALPQAILTDIRRIINGALAPAGARA